MTSKYVTELYGHPHQIMPSHIVITSPWFDTREIKSGRNVGGLRQCDFEFRRNLIYKMKTSGKMFWEIAKEMNMSLSSVSNIYYRFMSNKLT